MQKVQHYPYHIENTARISSAPKLVGLLFVFFALTPFTHWGLNSLDSQPWPLMSGLLYLMLAGRLPNQREITFICIIVAIIVPLYLLLNWPGIELAVRAAGSYFTLVVCMLVYYDYLVHFGMPVQMIYFVNLLYLVLAVAELYDPTINSGLSAARTSEGRGVTSLAAEPTYFAVILIFLSWLELLAFNYKPPKLVILLVLLNLIGVVFLAQSTMGLLFLVLAGLIICLYQLSRLRMKTIVAFLVFVVGGLYVLQLPALEPYLGFRMMRAVETFSYDGVTAIFQTDESMNIRLSSVVYAFDGMVRNYLQPGGFNTFGDLRLLQDRAYNGYFWAGETTDKINSYLGAICYELGFFGLLLVGVMSKGIVSRRTVLSYLECVTLLLFAAAAIPLAFAPIHLLFVTLLYNARGGNVKKQMEFGPRTFIK
jgi:hypothetical protein